MARLPGPCCCDTQGLARVTTGASLCCVHPRAGAAGRPCSKQIPAARMMNVLCILLCMARNALPNKTANPGNAEVNLQELYRNQTPWPDRCPRLAPSLPRDVKAKVAEANGAQAELQKLRHYVRAVRPAQAANKFCYLPAADHHRPGGRLHRYESLTAVLVSAGNAKDKAAEATKPNLGLMCGFSVYKSLLLPATWCQCKGSRGWQCRGRKSAVAASE